MTAFFQALAKSVLFDLVPRGISYQERGGRTILVNVESFSDRLGNEHFRLRKAAFMLFLSSPRIEDLFDTGQLKGKCVVLYFWTDACGCTEQPIALRKFIAGLEGKPFAFVTTTKGRGKPVPNVTSGITGSRTGLSVTMICP